MLTKKKKNHALRSLQLIGFTFEHEPCVNTQRILIKPARADKYFFHSPFLSPHYTCLTLKLSFFCTFPPTTTPPAEPQTPQQKRERPGRGRQRLWSDKQFLFFLFFQTSPDMSTCCPLPPQPFPQRTAICSGVLVVKLIFGAILIPLNRQEYRQEAFYSRQLLHVFAW